jgi:protein-tyrosine phosphatase
MRLPMTEVLRWQGPESAGTAVRRAVQALAEGRLVGFPTETVYGVAASAALPAAAARLERGKARDPGKPWTLALRSAAEALDYLPQLGRRGRRLAGRCWPGPITLVSGDGVEAGAVQRLPEVVRQRICPAGTVGLRVPAHAAVHEVLRLLPGPLLLTSANRSGDPPATTAEEVCQALGDEVAVVIDDGPSPLGQASTVVRVQGDRWEVLREGVVSSEDLQQLAATWIVFVCTGNTCRSPLAEALCKKLLAERLGCTPDELPQRGFLVLSAGLAAMMGGAAAPEAVTAARELGADLSRHRSQYLTGDLAVLADFLIVMTQGHLRLMTAQYPDLGVPPRLLCSDQGDLADPIGCDEAVYRECAQQILHALEGLLPEFLEP